MNHFARSHRLAAGSAAVALALSAATLVPQIQAQAPPPAPAVTAGDAQDFMAADALFNEGKWQEAMTAFEKFRDKYKMQSPRSLEAHYKLAICYLQQKTPLTKEAVTTLRALLANPKFNEPAAREQAQLLIPKAITMEGANMPNQTDVQKAAQAKVFEDALKEYGLFLQTYPQSRNADTVFFLTGTLQLNVGKHDEAVKNFSTVYQRFQNSPLRMSALMNIGKTFMAQGYGMMETKNGKDAPEADVKQALTILEKNAIPSLTAAYTQSGDLAIQNEAIYYLGQIQLTRSQNASGADEEATKKAQSDLLNLSLDAFRAVRSREEVIQAQEGKIAGLVKNIQMLKPGTPEYLPAKGYFENLIQLEEEKKKKFLDEQDQFLGARLAIARIFLFLKKPDECRVLLRYLQGQKELLEKEKTAQATIAALLCLTYTEQNNYAKAVELYEAFRAAFKGNVEGENLALIVANQALAKGEAERAEEFIAQGTSDFNPWRFTVEGNMILIGAALGKGNFAKALELCNRVLNEGPKPDVEAQVLYLKGTVQKAMGAEKSDPKLADEAMTTFQVVRDRFPASTQAEDAWAEQNGILTSRDAAKAQVELQKFIDQFGNSGGKSENTKTNLPIAQFRLGQVLEALNKKDEALKSYKAVYEKWPESEPAPGAYFKMFDIYKERKDYANCSRLMDEFVQKYPEHENVYYAFNNMAEFLFTGSLNPPKTNKDGKPLPAGQPTLADTEAGEKKLLEYVEYELSKDLKVKRGDSSLLKIADRWTERLSKLPPYLTQNPEQKQIWQRAIEGITAAVEKMIKSYPNGEKTGDGLERLVTAQREMLKAQITDVSKGEAYFRKLAGEASGPEIKAKLMFALGAFVQDVDPKKAAAVRAEGFALVAGAKPAEGSTGATFTAADWDRYLADLFDAKKYDDIFKNLEQIRAENKEAKEGEETPASVQNALAVALFWEAKVLGEQGKPVDAGAKYAELAKKYPKSTKVLEADYGIISGQVAQGNFKDDTFISRLNKVVLNVRDVKTFELPAKALFLTGQILEKQGDIEGAVSTFLKIHTRYASVPEVSGDGLWAGAQLLEEQAAGRKPVRTQKELAAAQQARAAKAKAAKDKEEAEKKKAEAEAQKANPKATEAKPANAPGVAKAEAVPAKK